MVNAVPLSSLVDELQSLGRYTFERDEALRRLRVTPVALKQSAARLIRAGRLVAPRRGFYVLVPLEHRAAGAPPPSWYIADLLRHADARGYVGLLSAAALYGAAHHAPQEYQVVVDRQLRPVTVGRSRIRFVLKRDVSGTPVVKRKMETGSVPVSTPEATALDLVQYAAAAGGIDAVATVLSALGEEIDGRALASTAGLAPRAVSQRLGWLLERTGHSDRAAPLHDVVAEWPVDVVPLRTGQGKDGPVDDRWRVRVDRDVEIDE